VHYRQVVAAEEAQFRFELIRVTRILGQHEQRRVTPARVLCDCKRGARTDQAAPGTAVVGRGLSGNEKRGIWHGVRQVKRARDYI
jgi:hypothetical protein